MSHEDAQSLIQAAMDGVVRTDPELKGASASKWYVVLETEMSEDRGRSLSIFRADRMTPWDCLGLLAFAASIEKDNMFDDGRDDLDDAYS